MAAAKAIKRSKNDKIYDAVIFVILTIVFLCVAYPLYFVVISSFSNPEAVAGGEVILLPVGVNFDGYKVVFKNTEVVYGFINSVIYTIVGTAISLVVTLPTAYALSRSDFYGKKFVTIFYLITMFVSGGMVPTYLVVKNCGLLDSVWALVLPGALSAYNMIVARTFFKTSIPNELLEAAKLDGCSNTRFFFTIVLPLSSAIIAILVLWYGVGQWNSYFSALIYISTKEKFPLQLVLRSILIQNSVALQKHTAVNPQELLEQKRQQEVVELMKYSLIIVSSLPVIMLYPLIQKYFVKGVMIGSLKG